MKSEHRHELETNVLSKELAVWIERVKPYTTAILAAIGVLIGGYAAASWWSSSRAARDREFWEAFQVQLNTSDHEYKQIRRLADSEDYAGAPGQEWAYLTWADRQLLLASDEYLQFRDQAMERLSSVAGAYDTLASQAANDEVANRARFGLARTYEMQNKLEAAQRQYAMVRGPLADLAAGRLEKLRSKSNQEVAEWLATAKLPKRPASGGLSDRPEFNVDVPSSSAAGNGLESEPDSIAEILGGLTTDEDDDRYGGEATSDGPTDDADSEQE